MNTSRGSMSRRTFVRAGSVAAATLAWSAASADRVFGANEKYRVGVIGAGARGRQVLAGFLAQPDVQIVALCDVSKSMIEKAQKMLPAPVDAYGDFRKLIERDDVDAVLVASPDHWHALHTVHACDAKKHVYVEKPLSLTIHEGRRMVEAARRNNRVVQVGTHRRSSPVYAKAFELVHSGKIGKVTVARSYRLSNMFPNGIGWMKPTPPPADLDWDMWLGPRAEQPYQGNITPYKFRWWKVYSSQMGNWGVHYLDATRWLTEETAPASICAMGGVFAVNDDRTIPDTMEATFQFASGRLAIFGQYEASGNPALPRGELELRGTQGTLYMDPGRMEVLPERGGQFQDGRPRMKPVSESDKGGNAHLTVRHVRNFLDCIKSGQRPVADVEIGHRSTSLSHLANISLAVGQRLEWDAQAERFTNSEAANAMLHYEYRSPWKLA